MLNIVLVHIGDTFPVFLQDTVKQIRRNTSIPIYLLCSKELSSTDCFKSFNVEKVDYTPFIMSEKNKRFESINFLNKYGHNGFWSYALQRLIFLEVFMKYSGITSVIHMENDVAIYHDPEYFEGAFKENFSSSIACNPIGPIHASAAYMYVDKAPLLGWLNNALIEHLMLGESRLFNEIPEAGCINEMVLINYIHKKEPDRIKYLPVLPNFEYFDKFNSLFDCASWGQYAGGTPDVSGGLAPGCFFPHHWVGIEMAKGLYDLIWGTENGNKIPYVLDKTSKNKIKMNCLHIHCKRVSEFI